LREAIQPRVDRHMPALPQQRGRPLEDDGDDRLPVRPRPKQLDGYLGVSRRCEQFGAAPPDRSEALRGPGFGRPREQKFPEQGVITISGLRLRVAAHEVVAQIKGFQDLPGAPLSGECLGHARARCRQERAGEQHLLLVLIHPPEDLSRKIVEHPLGFGATWRLVV
jgi:hypothetical protein